MKNLYILASLDSFYSKCFGGGAYKNDMSAKSLTYSFIHFISCHSTRLDSFEVNWNHNSHMNQFNTIHMSDCAKDAESDSNAKSLLMLKPMRLMMIHQHYGQANVI